MPLPRLQLVELEDLRWFPSIVRDLATDYLQFMQASFGLHRTIVPILSDMLAKTQPKAIVDLCSGAGGPLPALSEVLAYTHNPPLPVILTDKFPNLRSGSGHIPYVAESVDATNVPHSLPGLRTMFNGFHHFAPAAARSVLESAVEARQPIAIFEFSDRRLRSMIPFLFTPVYVVLATPFIRPFRLARLLWTYLIPLVPLTCWWDGIVSQWRAYTPEELLQLTQGLDKYEWTSERVPVIGTLGHLTYLIGLPAAVADSHHT